jgi:hypothetical protein
LQSLANCRKALLFLDLRRIMSPRFDQENQDS